MGKTESGTYSLCGCQEKAETWRLKAELLNWPSCVQTPQQKLQSDQQGTEALGQTRVQNPEPCRIDRAITGSVPGAGGKAREDQEHESESASLL